jgi:hypothetical protein
MTVVSNRFVANARQQSVSCLSPRFVSIRFLPDFPERRRFLCAESWREDMAGGHGGRTGRTGSWGSQ